MTVGVVGTGVVGIKFGKEGDIAKLDEFVAYVRGNGETSAVLGEVTEEGVDGTVVDGFGVGVVSNIILCILVAVKPVEGEPSSKTELHFASLVSDFYTCREGKRFVEVASAGLGDDGVVTSEGTGALINGFEGGRTLRERAS